MKTDYDYLMRVTLVGDSGVGKSSLMMRFADDVFEESFVSTVGVDFKLKKKEVDGKIIKLQIWDTAGQDRYRAICSSYYRGAHGIVIVYDITNEESFSHVKSWLEEVERYGRDDACKLLIGNKYDLEAGRAVSYEIVKTFADQMNLIYLETSAKDSTNVEQAFTTMITEFKNRLCANDDTDDDFVKIEYSDLSAKYYQAQKSVCC